MAQKRYFEDLKKGETRRSSVLEVSENDIIEFAKKHDPEWFHTVPEKAKESVFGGLIASGIHTVGMFRVLDYEMNNDLEAICGLEWKSARFPNPVRPGEKVYAETIVEEMRKSNSDPSRGIITSRGRLINQDGATALEMTVVQLIHCRPVTG